MLESFLDGFAIDKLCIVWFIFTPPENKKMTWRSFPASHMDVFGGLDLGILTVYIINGYLEVERIR